MQILNGVSCRASRTNGSELYIKIVQSGLHVIVQIDFNRSEIATSLVKLNIFVYGQMKFRGIIEET